MDGYISNKRKIEKVSSVLGIVFWIVNFIFWEMSISMLVKIIIANGSGWFEAAAIKEKQNDAFFSERIGLIMNTVVIILIVIVVFAAVTIVLYRNIQLSNMQTQMAIYWALGYGKYRIFKINILESLMDWIIAFPVSIVISCLIWRCMIEIDAVSYILDLIDNIIMIDMMSYISAAILMFIVTVLHTKIFMIRSMRKGISYMLGKGAV